MNGRVTDNNIFHPFVSVRIRYSLVICYSSGDYVTCPVMFVCVRSVRCKVLRMFKTFHRTERTKASVTCSLGIRMCPFCPVLVRYIFGSSPLRFRWRPVDPSHDRTTTGTWNGQNGDVTDEYRTPTEEKRIDTDNTVRLTDTERLHRRCTERRPEMTRIKRTTNGHERRPIGQYKCHLSCSHLKNHVKKKFQYL